LRVTSGFGSQTALQTSVKFFTQTHVVRGRAID